MKRLYKLLILILFVFISNSMYSQITVVDAIAIDGDGDGYYGTLEIQFSTDVDRSDVVTSAVNEKEWIFSLDPTFSDTLFATAVNDDVDDIVFGGNNDNDDEYLQVTFSSQFASSSGPIYFRYTNNNATCIDDSPTPTDTLFDFPIYAARDFAPPVIDSIISDATDVDTLIVGESIKFTIYFADTVPDPYLTILPLTYNGQNLNWNTSDAGKTYNGMYTVTENDDDQLSNERQLENVTAEDQDGNVSDPPFDGTDVKKYIDAHTPTIVSVVSNAASVDTLLVDESIVFTIDIDDLNPDPDLIITPLQYNGRDLNWGTSDGGDSYQGTYDNIDGGIDQVTPLQLTGVIAKDPAGNTSNTFNGSDVAVAIDANKPAINTVTSDALAAGTLIVGDTITFTVDVSSSPDGSLNVSPPDYNGRALNWYTGDGGNTYTGKYIVTNGDPDQTSAIDLPGVTLTDPAGNVSNSEDGVVNKLIDANLPNITSVSITVQNRKIGENGEIFINIDADTENNDYTIVSGNVEGFAIHTLVRVGDLQLQASFTVTENNINILATDDVDVISLQVQDKAGNKSNVWNQTISQGTDALYGKRPEAEIFGTESICDGDSINAPIVLTGIQPFSITYTDGHTPVIIDPINSSFYNVNAIADKTIDNPILYSIVNVTDATGNSQAGTGTFTLNIYDLPDASFDKPIDDDNFDISQDTVDLVGDPTGGIFSGNAVISESDQFSPKIAGLGFHDLYYNYEDANGCKDSDTITIKVIEGGTITFTQGKTVYCSYTDTFSVTGFNNFAEPGSFNLVGDPGGALINIAIDTAIVKPELLSPGNYTIKYSYPSGEDIVSSFSVEKVSDLITFTPIGDQCEDYDDILIEAKYLDPLGGNGYFTFSDGGVDLHKTNKGNNIYFAAGDIVPAPYSLEYYYLTVNGCSSDTITEAFVVNALPVVDITMEDLYDINGGTHLIWGSPATDQGSFSPGFMIDNGDGSATFDPQIAGLGEDTALYTYIDINGCINTDTAFFSINEADAEIFGLEVFDSHYQYCYFNSTSDTVWAIATNGDGSKGTFYIDNIKVTAEIGTDSIIINPLSLTEGDHILRFSYKNAPVEFNVEYDFNVDYIDVLDIIGLGADYCEDDYTPVELTGIFSGQAGVGEFTGNGITGTQFIPINAVPGTNNITYTFTRDYSGCYRNVIKSTNINKTPGNTFLPSNSCIINEQDSVEFRSDTTLSDSVRQWFWRIDNTKTIQESYDSVPKVSLVQQVKNFVSLTLTTDKGCTTVKDSSIFIGSVVDLDFDWDKECDGDTVTFTVIAATDPIGVDSLKWDFGGAGVVDSTDIYNPLFYYSGSGGYDVVYTEYTTTCGMQTETKRINIRPSVDVSSGEYFDDFEDNPDATGWAVDVLESSVNTTWQWGNPDGTLINSAASGSGAFVTNLTGNYRNNEYSVLSSPCFNLSTLTRPMISFDFISAMETNREGILMEYATNIDNWQPLGVSGEGVNWYNSFSIAGGIIGQSSGWTGDGDEFPLDVDVKWRSAKYALDDITELEGVRFRLIFGSDGYTVDEGFGFDNIRIRNRNRTVLLENFANMDDAQYAQYLDNQIIITNSMEENPLDVTAIQYFTSYPSENDISLFYASGPSARSLYYGVSQVPYSIVDGGDRQFNYSSTNTLTNSDIEKRTLEESQFKVSVKQEVTGSTLEVSSTIKALADLAGIKLSARIAIVEKTIVDNSIEIRNVLRAMLPDPAGILIIEDWNTNDSITIYQTWTITDGINTDSIATIVYLQDEETKEIYQAGYTDEFSEVTSVNELINSNTLVNYVAYPNPVSGMLTIRLTNTLDDDIEIRVYNNTGATVKVDRLMKGTERVDINTEDLPVGVYYLKLISDDKSFNTKKIIKSN